MTIEEMLSITGSVFFALGGGAAFVFPLSTPQWPKEHPHRQSERSFKINRLRLFDRVFYPREGSKWLGEVSANRILENERATRAREYELLVRRRDTYAKLVISLRTFLATHRLRAPDTRDKFL